MTHEAFINQDLSFLKNDIEKFNLRVLLTNNPRWINPKHTEKQHSTLVLIIANQTGLNIAKKGLNIFEIMAKTEVFI